MKHIIKQVSPTDFEAWKKNKKNRKQDLERIKNLTLEGLNERRDNLKSKKQVYKNLRISLLEEQGFICCYCQNKISLDLNNVEIEHLIPRSVDGTLAFEYDNLLASCKGGRKNEDEEVTEGHCNYWKGNKTLIITPLQDDCENYYSYIEIYDTDDLQIKVIGLNANAETVIQTLNLNTPKLRRLRGAALSGYLENISKTNAKILLLKLEAESNNSTPQPLRPFIQILIHLLKYNYIGNHNA